MEHPINYNFSLTSTNETRSDYIQHVIMFAIFYPAAIITNLLLVIIILAKKDLREDHSRWTSLHTSIAGLIFLINSYIYAIEKFRDDVPWLKSTSCHMTTLIDGVVSHVAKFSLLLVSADRVWAIWRPAHFPQGLSKTFILVSILIMWLINIFVFPTVYFKAFEKAMSGAGHHFEVCDKSINSRNVSIYYVWPYLPIFLIIVSDIIAMAYFLGKRHDYINEEDVRAIAIPTIVMDIFFVLLYFPYMVMLFCYATGNFIKLPDVTFYNLIIIFWAVYPLAWLTSRGISREISPCAPADNKGESARLISVENVQEFAVQDRPAQITIKLPAPSNN